ncbi:MAG: PEP-CTERM sorting domain-containing protein [Planctomycetia bacterium]|nr:PEP-CTERM sorting domain-containing protein [Planctomycetia bacterium]
MFCVNAAEFVYTGAATENPYWYYNPANWQGGVRPQTGDTAKIADGTFRIVYSNGDNATNGWFDVTDGIDLLIQNATVNVKPSSDGYARFYVTGDTTATIDHSTLISGCEIVVGARTTKTGWENAGPGTLLIYNGSQVTAESYNLILGWQGGASGTLEIGKSGETEASTLTSNWAVVVGDTGTGKMTIDGRSVVRSLSNSDNTPKNDTNFNTHAGVLIGNGAGSTGTVTVNGGLLESANAYSIFVGNWGTGNLNLDGGEARSTHQILVGVQSGSRGTINMTGGTLNSSSGIYFGIFGTSQGYGNFSGGTLASNGNFVLADSSNESYGEVHFSGDAKLTNTAALTIGAVGKGVMTVSDTASIQTSGNLLVGQDTGAVGELTIRGGTVAERGNIVIGGTSFFGDAGIRKGSGTVHIYGGEFTSGGWLCVGGTGTGTLNAYGGTIQSDSASIATRAGSTGMLLLDGGNLQINQLFLGEEGDGTLTLKSGTYTNRSGNLPILNFYSGTSATLNVVSGNQGNGWTLAEMKVYAASTPTMNFLAGWEDGDIAKLTVGNTTSLTFHGTVHVGMEYPLGFLAATEYEVFATPSTTLTLTGTKEESLFAITTPENNKIVATLQNIHTGEYAIGDFLTLSNRGKSGAVRLSNANIPNNFEIALGIEGLESLDTLAAWLETLMLEAGVGVRAEDSSLVLSNIAADLVNGWLAWDFSDFAGDFSVVSLNSYEVPEPATWGMLLVGLGFFILRKKMRT